jgi:mRNA-degrading endonuclease HigB of HigAB toxin-antitoxin module
MPSPVTAADPVRATPILYPPRAQTMLTVLTQIPRFVRAHFEVAGGNYRLIAAFDFHRQIVFVKFIGTHAEYDSVHALTVAQF